MLKIPKFNFRKMQKKMRTELNSILNDAYLNVVKKSLSVVEMPYLPYW